MLGCPQINGITTRKAVRTSKYKSDDTVRKISPKWNCSGGLLLPFPMPPNQNASRLVTNGVEIYIA
jgi:hypothetical protein